MPSIRSQTAIALIILAAGPAVADVCVKCSGPAATYACAVKKADQIEALAGAKAVSKICTQVLKRKGQHAGCDVVETGACPGTATTIGWREVKEALAAKGDTPATASPGKTPALPPQKATDAKPPPTDKIVAAPPPSPNPVPEEPAGASPTIVDNVKGAAEKTWKCVSSFFGQC